MHSITLARLERSRVCQGVISALYVAQSNGSNMRQAFPEGVKAWWQHNFLFAKKSHSPQVIQWPWPPSYPHNTWRSRKQPLSSGSRFYLNIPKRVGHFFPRIARPLTFKSESWLPFFCSGSLYLMGVFNEIITTKNWNRISSKQP